MLRRDYIQRMIEEFGKMLGHVAGLRALNEDQLALDELRKGYKTYFGLDADLIAKKNEEELLADLLHEKQLKYPQLEAIAFALEMEGDILFSSFPFAIEYYRKAFTLLNYLEEKDTATFSISRKEALARLKEKLF